MNRIDEGQSLNDDIYPSNWENSEFCDPDDDHIIAGDVRLIKNQKLRKPLTKGPNCRESHSLNYSRSKIEIDHAIGEIHGGPKLKDKLEVVLWTYGWTKSKKKLKQIKSTFHVLQDKEITQCLKDFVLTLLDKAANYFSFICKKF